MESGSRSRRVKKQREVFHVAQIGRAQPLRHKMVEQVQRDVCEELTGQIVKWKAAKKT